MKKLTRDENKIVEYYKILEPQFPEWLNNYINTVELQKQKYISTTCGAIYSSLIKSERFFSSLDHSVGVALIIWHFTHDKKQTIAGLLHDIATPAFKHCIDFLLGDAENQEATEDLTSKIIFNSTEILNLLKKDRLTQSEVEDYHIYPIADNDTPQLSADRLEYSLSNALFTYELANIKEIKEIYDNIYIQKNERGIVELGFKSKEIAEKFVGITSKLSIIYREDKTRFSMQFLADIIKRLNEEKVIDLEYLYKVKEEDVIKLIKDSRYKDIFNIWQNAKVVNSSKDIPSNVYFVHTKAKVRYIDPLVNGVRVSKLSEFAKNLIEKNLEYNMDNYVYLNLRFDD